ncbi:MAG: tetratricopeptide repeat protein [Pseudomonadota bacterium]
MAEAHYNLANVLQDTGQIAESLTHYGRAVTLKPDYVEAHWNRSLMLLLSGDFAAGWPEYEWRWRRRNAELLRRPFTVPQWRGEPLDGKRILLHAEQGLGDTLQFCRYLALVGARRPAEMVLEVPQPLVGLMTDSFADAGVRVVPLDPGFPRGDSLPRFDLHCPLLSLPLAFGTTVDTIPGDTPLSARRPGQGGPLGAPSGRRTAPPDRPGMGGRGACQQSRGDRHRPPPQHRARPIGAAGQNFRGRLVQSAEGPAGRPGQGSAGRADPDRPDGRGRGFRRHRGAGGPTRPGDQRRHLGRPCGGGLGQTGLAVVALRWLLALAARPR